MNICFTVYGIPQPQGSTRAFMPKGGKFPVVTSDNAKLKPWRQEIAGVAFQQTAGMVIAQGPVSVEADFFFERPKSVKSVFKLTKPDIDKLLRGILDAMTGIVFRDDSQIVHCVVQKEFGSPARAVIRVQDFGVVGSEG